MESTLLELAQSPLSCALSYKLSLLLILGLLYPLSLIFLRPLFSPLRHLPGPKRRHLLWGNWEDVLPIAPGEADTRWSRQFGGVFKMADFFGSHLLVVSDPAAIKHIFQTKSYGYSKPPHETKLLERIVGPGLLIVEGADHQRQRKIMQPAFSHGALREMDHVWWDTAARLRDVWIGIVTNSDVDPKCFRDSQAAEAYRATRPEGENVSDPSRWMRKATMDIIGLAGFGHSFDSLDASKTNKLADAHRALMMPAEERTVHWSAFDYWISRNVEAFVGYFPWLLSIVPDKKTQQIRAALATSEAEGRTILEERGREGIDGGNGRDILSLLLKSNRGVTKLRMTDRELLGQMTMMMLAGHETTGTALIWAMHCLTQHQHVQSKLREEAFAATRRAREEGRDDLNGDDVTPSNMPYLEAFTRECLRFEIPIDCTVRCATVDDELPLSTPITLTTGQIVDRVPIKAGTAISVSLRACNFNPDIYGPTVDEFRPERWLEGEEDKIGEGLAGGGVPGVWGKQFTFIDGPRACIGFKLALLEFKAILVTLIQAFEFDKRDAGTEIVRRCTTLVVEPVVVGEEHLGYRLPIKVRLLATAE